MITINEVLEAENMRTAYKQVVGNKGAAGVDNMPVSDLKAHLDANWKSLKVKIQQGKYRPQAVRRVEIPKPKGGKRQLGIPTVTDRLIQQGIAQQLSGHYEPLFSDFSYGFRPNRSCHDALDKALEYLNGGYEYLVEIDLSKFFDRVNHDRLMYKLSTQVTDKALLKLIRKYLQSGVMEEGVVQKTEEGTPQGGNLSPILSNIVLDELDKELEKRGHKFVRYADDISIFVKSRRAGERVLQSVSKYIENKLKLKVNEDKSGVWHYAKGSMLGFGFYKDSEGIQSRITKQSYLRFKQKLKRITSRNWSVSFDYRMSRLNQLIRGWIGYYAKAKGRSKLRKIDAWLRSRLRMCIWKQWKRVRTRMRSLMRLGTSKQKAYEWANTRKGYWRISKSPILHRTITNAILQKRGCLSIVETYNRYH